MRIQRLLRPSETRLRWAGIGFFLSQPVHETGHALADILITGHLAIPTFVFAGHPSALCGDPAPHADRVAAAIALAGPGVQLALGFGVLAFVAARWHSDRDRWVGALGGIAIGGVGVFLLDLVNRTGDLEKAGTRLGGGSEATMLGVFFAAAFGVLAVAWAVSLSRHGISRTRIAAEGLLIVPVAVFAYSIALLLTGLVLTVLCAVT